MKAWKLESARSAGTKLPDRQSARLQRRRALFRKSERVVHHDDGESNWLTSYADMMTLLVGFFVLLLTASKFDLSKIERFRRDTAKSMGVDFERPFRDLVDGLHAMDLDPVLKSQVQVSEVPDGAMVSVRGPLFFDSGSSELRSDAETLLIRIADLLVEKGKNFRVVVEGHTDDAPMSSDRFPSNWELSSARAGTVVRMLESHGFPHAKLRPLGFADTEPLLANRTQSGEPIPENQAMNRRIVIRIQKNK